MANEGASSTAEVKAVAEFRRARLLKLFEAYRLAQLEGNEPAEGIKQRFARRLEISPSYWSMLMSGARPVSGAVARQIEKHLHLEAFALDQPLDDNEAGESQARKAAEVAETAFLELARAAWRAGNARTKRAYKTSFLADLAAAAKKAGGKG